MGRIRGPFFWAIVGVGLEIKRSSVKHAVRLIYFPAIKKHLALTAKVLFLAPAVGIEPTTN